MYILKRTNIEELPNTHNCGFTNGIASPHLLLSTDTNLTKTSGTLVIWYSSPGLFFQLSASTLPCLLVFPEALIAEKTPTKLQFF